VDKRIDRKEAFARVESLLEQGGELEALEEMRRAAQALEAYEKHGETLAALTESLLASDKTYRLVFSHELDPMSLFDPATGAILEVNESWVALYGYTREEALAMKVTDVSAEPSQTEEAIELVPSGASTRVNVRWHRAKDGTLFPVELTAGKLLLGEREVMYAVMRDITQRHRAERALARSEASYRALIESMPDAVIVHRHGALVYMSPSARRMLGYGPEDDIVGKPAIEIVHPDDRAMVLERVMGMVKSGNGVAPLEERLLRRDGTFVIAEVAALNSVFDGEAAVLALARDITERKTIEAQLVMNDRLASLGRMSASVGHELNNPLAYILGNVALMERELAHSPDVPPEFTARFATYVKVVGEGAARMRDIVHDLRTLARGDGKESGPVDLGPLLDVCANMAEHELRPGTRLVKDYQENLVVVGTEARLGQVFLNLLVNAAHAIPEAEQGRDDEVRITARATGDEVIVEIGDTGTGVPSSQVDQIFEPFFTTKEGVGTGLGLAISHRIVTSAGGTIRCEPREGGGTIFRVVLPTQTMRSPPPPRP
jgi:PAS domain S-box-containing protein